MQKECISCYRSSRERDIFACPNCAIHTCTLCAGFSPKHDEKLCKYCLEDEQAEVSPIRMEARHETL